MTAPCTECGETREIVANNLCSLCYREAKSDEFEAPADMADEELAEFVAKKATAITALCNEMRPYFMDLRSRFINKESRSTTIYGCRTWDEYCEKVLDRTRRAVNYFLAGGNPANNKRGSAQPTEVGNDFSPGASKPEPDFTCAGCGNKFSGGTYKCPECECEDPVAKKLFARSVCAKLQSWLLVRPCDAITMAEAMAAADVELIKDLEWSLADAREFMELLGTLVMAVREKEAKLILSGPMIDGDELRRIEARRLLEELAARRETMKTAKAAASGGTQ